MSSPISEDQQLFRFALGVVYFLTVHRNCQVFYARNVDGYSGNIGSEYSEVVVLRTSLITASSYRITLDSKHKCTLWGVLQRLYKIQIAPMEITGYENNPHYLLISKDSAKVVFLLKSIYSSYVVLLYIHQFLERFSFTAKWVTFKRRNVWRK